MMTRRTASATMALTTAAPITSTTLTRMPPLRPIAGLAFLLAAAVFVASVVAMIQRVVDYNLAELPARPYFMPVEQLDFLFGDRSVTFEHVDGEGIAPNTVRVTYGGAEPIDLRESIPNEIGSVPDLRRYEEWLRVYRMVMVDSMSVEAALEAVERDEIDDRLVLVALRPPAGADTTGWGRIWVHQYRFDLIEFREDGTIVSETLKYPSKRNPGDPVPEGELVEGTWQYDAAMESLPPVYRAEPVDNQNASLSLGWTFPVAGVSSLVAMLSLVLFLVIPRRPSQVAAAPA